MVCRVLVALSVLGWTAGVASAAPQGAGATVSSASLQVDELAGGTDGGKVALVGFSWNGPVVLFADGFAAAGLELPGDGGESFQMAGKGAVTVCRALEQAASEERPLGDGKITFKGEQGVVRVVKLNGVTVQAADCSAKPWTAELAAAKVKEGKAGKSKKAKAARG